MREKKERELQEAGEEVPKQDEQIKSPEEVAAEQTKVREQYAAQFSDVQTMEKTIISTVLSKLSNPVGAKAVSLLSTLKQVIPWEAGENKFARALTQN